MEKVAKSEFGRAEGMGISNGAEECTDFLKKQFEAWPKGLRKLFLAKWLRL